MTRTIYLPAINRTVSADKYWVFVWNYDEEGCIGCDCGNAECACSSGRPHEVLYCLLKEDEDGRVLGSLSGICEPSREYRRVVEAELALEAAHCTRPHTTETCSWCNGVTVAPSGMERDWEADNFNVLRRLPCHTTPL